MNDVHVLLGGVVCIGGATYVTGVIFRLRATMAARVSKRESVPEDRRELVRKMERDARHRAPIIENVGMGVALVGFLAWLVTT